MSNLAVFMDRDDTLNYDPGYLNNPDDVKLYPGVGEGLAQLKNELGFKLIVISNQSGITRGLITLEQVQAVNTKINEILKNYNTEIDDFFFCPYHPDFDDEDKIRCRKPSPQMVLDAAKKYDIELKGSYFIGDQLTDIECGNRAGLKTILITNKISPDEIINLKNDKKTPNFVALNFLEACDFITNDLKEI